MNKQKRFVTTGFLAMLAAQAVEHGLARLTDLPCAAEASQNQ